MKIFERISFPFPWRRTTRLLPPHCPRRTFCLLLLTLLVVDQPAVPPSLTLLRMLPVLFMTMVLLLHMIKIGSLLPVLQPLLVVSNGVSRLFCTSMMAPWLCSNLVLLVSMLAQFPFLLPPD